VAGWRRRSGTNWRRNIEMAGNEIWRGGNIGVSSMKSENESSGPGVIRKLGENG